MGKLLNTKLLEIIGSLTSIAGVFTIALGNPFIGFVFSFTASLTFTVYAYLTEQKFFCLSSIVYMVADITGLLHWWNV